MGARLGTLSVWVGLAACTHTSGPASGLTDPEPTSGPATPSSACAEGWVAEAEALEDVSVERARARLETCLRAAPGPPSAYRLLATLQQAKGEAEGALRTLLKAVAVHPDDPFAWAGVARLQAGLGRGPAALGSLERAYRLRPEDDALRQELTQARRRFGTAFDRRFGLLSALLSEADGRLDLGDLDGVEGVLLRAEALAGDDQSLCAHVELRRAWVALAREDPEKAAGAVDQALKSLAQPGGEVPKGTGEDELRADLLVIQSELALRIGECETAWTSATEALRRRARHPLAATNLGVASACQGDLDAAERHYRSAVAWGLGTRLDRETFVALDGVAELMARQADFAALVDTVWPR